MNTEPEFIYARSTVARMTPRIGWAAIARMAAAAPDVR
jgi:hypothetical protein